MAGNVKEWCWNESRGGRMILGGGWNEPTYMYRGSRRAAAARASADLWIPAGEEHRATAGCVAGLSPAVRARLLDREADRRCGVFVARSVYRYDPRPLDARLERSEDAPDWRRETVTFDAAYGKERVIAYLYLPKSAAPPYQTIVYFPGGDAPLLRSSRQLNLTNVEFVIRSGRALVFPVYQGTYERGPAQAGPNAFRDVTIARVKDFGRVIDYIETRQRSRSRAHRVLRRQPRRLHRGHDQRDRDRA